MLGMVLVAWKLEVPVKELEVSRNNSKAPSLMSKLKRVDFVGAILMSITILSFLLVMDIGGAQVAWTSFTILILGAICITSALIYIMVEKTWSREPIFPLFLLVHYDVVTSYVTLAMQNAFQTAVRLPQLSSAWQNCIEPN